MSKQWVDTGRRERRLRVAMDRRGARRREGMVRRAVGLRWDRREDTGRRRARRWVDRRDTGRRRVDSDRRREASGRREWGRE